MNPEVPCSDKVIRVMVLAISIGYRHSCWSEYCKNVALRQLDGVAIDQGQDGEMASSLIGEK